MDTDDFDNIWSRINLSLARRELDRFSLRISSTSPRCVCEDGFNSSVWCMGVRCEDGQFDRVNLVQLIFIHL
ncbi:unnamed protein product [Calypogeia fissa]